MLEIVSDKVKEIEALCVRYSVKSLFVFGSVLTSRFNASSDIDFAVEFKSEGIENPFHNFCDLHSALVDLFQRPIDLVDDKGMKNPVFRKELNQTRQLVYGLA